MTWQTDAQRLEQLLALADGELPIERQPAALAYLAEHPEAARWLAEQVQLFSQLRRGLNEHADPTPPALRGRIERMAVPQRRWRWPVSGLSAAAAIVLVGWLIFRGGDRPHPTTPIGAVIPANIVSHASRVHDDCSRVIEVNQKLHGDAFPAAAGALAAGIERDLHQPQPIPDFAPLDFHYVGAGPCGAPLRDAIHLLYHSNRPRTNRTISLFVQPFTGQFALDRSTVYTVSVSHSPFPMLAWRSESVVYFLLADDEATARAALALVHKP